MASGERRTLLLEVSYLGRYFHGVQLQGKHRSVASELQARVTEALGTPLVGLVFASRTDSGVSAEQNFATGWLRQLSHEPNLQALCRPTISPLQIKRAVWVPRSLQARNCARHKHYQYRIVPDGSSCADAWRVVPPLDPVRMQAAALALLGEHDFAAFRASSCQAHSTVRTLHRLEVTATAEAILVDVEGDGFLKRMVRVIVGTLVAAGCGWYSAAQVREILLAKDRRRAGLTAPAEGLTLKRVALLWPGQRHPGMPLLHSRAEPIT